MPLYVVIGHDIPDGLSRRNVIRPDHVAYIESLYAAGKITFAGPLLTDDHRVSNGVVMIFEASDLEDAKRIVHGDPYVMGGVYADLEIRAIRKVFPKDG